jgi:hypothetical protein
MTTKRGVKESNDGMHRQQILVSDQMLLQACSYLSVQEVACLTNGPMPPMVSKTCQVQLNRAVSETTLRNISSRYPHLSSLSISGPQPFSISWFMALVTFHHIHSVKMQEIDNWPSHEDTLLEHGMQLVADAWGSQLTTLDLRGCTCLSDEHLATLLFKGSLKWINAITDKQGGVAEVASTTPDLPVPRFPHLHSLNLSDCVALSYKAWCIVALQSRLSPLQSVNVRGCHGIFDYTTTGVQLARKSLDMQVQRSVHVEQESGVHTGKGAWLHISRPILNQLTHLDISHNMGVTDRLLDEWFSDTPTGTMLTFLNVSFCPRVTKRTLDAIGVMENLQTLHMSGCSHMSLKDLQKIYSLQHLSNLSFSEQTSGGNRFILRDEMPNSLRSGIVQGVDSIEEEELIRTILALHDKPLVGLVDAVGNQLTKLLLQRCSEVVVDALGVCMLQGSLAHIQQLDISHSVLPASGKICEGIGHLQKLNALTLNYSCGPGFRSNCWALLGKSRELEHLHVRGCEDFDEDTLTCMFEGYAEKGNWKTLDMRGCPGVTDHVIASIVNQLHSRHIQHFDIAECKSVTINGLIMLIHAWELMAALRTFGFDFTKCIFTPDRYAQIVAGCHRAEKEQVLHHSTCLRTTSVSYHAQHWMHALTSLHLTGKPTFDNMNPAWDWLFVPNEKLIHLEMAHIGLQHLQPADVVHGICKGTKNLRHLTFKNSHVIPLESQLWTHEHFRTLFKHCEKLQTVSIDSVHQSRPIALFEQLIPAAPELRRLHVKQYYGPSCKDGVRVDDVSAVLAQNPYLCFVYARLHIYTDDMTDEAVWKQLKICTDWPSALGHHHDSQSGSLSNQMLQDRKSLKDDSAQASKPTIRCSPVM